jgi:hypothetical protein
MSNYVPVACFGSAIAYSADADICKACEFREQCAPLAAERLIAFQAKYAIEKAPKNTRGPITKAKLTRPAPAVPAASAATVAHMLTVEVPVKVLAHIERIRNKGIDVAAALTAGINPFPAKPAFLHIACQLLLDHGPIDRTTLRTCFMESLNWTYGTANAHVGQVFSLLPALDAATEANGRLQLRG